MNKNDMGYGLKMGDYGEEIPYKGNSSLGPKSKPSQGANPLSMIAQIMEQGLSRIERLLSQGVQVKFPDNVSAPVGSDSLDLRRLPNVPAGSTNLEIFRYVVPQGVYVKITQYGVFTDILNGEEFAVIPRVNGNRILPNHGDPNLNFAINLSLGPDLTNSSLVDCEIYLKPNDVLTWSAKNTSAIDAPIGIRVVGHIDKTNKIGNSNFGG